MPSMSAMARCIAASARDPRIVVRDGVNARDLTATHVPEPPQAIVADVSFIGLKLALPPALAMAAPGAWLVALVKPQFEVGTAAGSARAASSRDAELQAEALARHQEFHRRPVALDGARPYRKPDSRRRRQQRISDRRAESMTLCRHFGVCGGCTLQNLSPDDYRAHKRRAW